jgi:hypothetical protein
MKISWGETRNVRKVLVRKPPLGILRRKLENNKKKMGIKKTMR